MPPLDHEQAALPVGYDGAHARDHRAGHADKYLSCLVQRASSGLCYLSCLLQRASSGLCVGTPTTAAQDTFVWLQPCGASPKTE